MRRSRVRYAALLALLALAAVLVACGAIPFEERPAAGYGYGSGAPLVVSVRQEAGGDWTSAVDDGLRTYADAAPLLRFVPSPAAANIDITFRGYTDETPPDLQGYAFPAGAGGFAAVYDVQGVACNYPPSSLPLTCSGEIATVIIYLNDDIPPGSDVEARRHRLVLHELGHALGLTRHSPSLDVAQLAARYGWPEKQ